MPNRFIILGIDENLKIESGAEQKCLISVEFNAEKLEIDLHVFRLKSDLRDKLESWVNGGALESGIVPENSIVRTVEDANLLPDHIKVNDAGKVRQIEIEWANTLIQSRLMQGFNTEMDLLKDKVSSLEFYNQQLFDDCKSYWERLLTFSKEHKVDRDIVDNKKIELDILFEVLKSIRKEERKEFDEKSLKLRDEFLKKLDAIKQEDKPPKSLFNALKELHNEFASTRLRQSHKAEIKKLIDEAFDGVKKQFGTKDNSKINKRISDLEGIIEKMNKGLDWDKRELKKHHEFIEKTDQKFQIKLLEMKVKIIEAKITEKEAKLKNIRETYESLKKKIS